MSNILLADHTTLPSSNQTGIIYGIYFFLRITGKVLSLKVSQQRSKVLIYKYFPSLIRPGARRGAVPDSVSAPLSLKTGLPLLRLPRYWSPDQASSVVHVSSDFKQVVSVRGDGRVIYTNYFRYNIQPVTRCQAALAPPVYLCPPTRPSIHG